MPRRASERATAPGGCRLVPIVILGGSNASASGALLFPGAESEESSDGLVDGIFFGEGEGAIGALAIALTRAGASRSERLAGAAAIDGFWRALSGMAAKRKILLPYPPPLTEYPVLNSEGAATARLQISSGCPGYCSFCLEGWESRPYREIGPSELSKAARELKARTGASGLDVYSFNFNAHARIFDLMLDLNRVFRRVNFMSQRLDILAESPLLASAELAADKRSFTLGIEGISERMRRFYRKGLEARDIDAALDRLSLPAVRELKLFYIVSGIEEDADFAEFADFAAATSERRRRMAPGQRVIASVGYLVRLPFTPLQYAPLCLDRARLESLSRRIEGICAASGLECRRAADFEEYYADQLLALGGRTLAPWLERTPEEGLVYDGGPSRGTGASLEAFAAQAGLLDGGFADEKGEDWRPPSPSPTRTARPSGSPTSSPPPSSPARLVSTLRRLPRPDGFAASSASWRPSAPSPRPWRGSKSLPRSRGRAPSTARPGSCGPSPQPRRRGAPPSSTQRMPSSPRARSSRAWRIDSGGSPISA